MLKILYFASLREALGQGSEQIELPPEVGDVAGLIAFLATRGGPWGQLPEVRNLRCAVNQEMAKPESPVAADDEVAFFPPVSGG